MLKVRYGWEEVVLLILSKKYGESFLPILDASDRQLEKNVVGVSGHCQLNHRMMAAVTRFL
jgi:hypothetical protein